MPRLSNRVKEDPVRGGLREREREEGEGGCWTKETRVGNGEGGGLD